MSHFLKMAVLSPILSTKRLSAIALVKVALHCINHHIESFFLYSYQYPQSHSKSKVQILYIAWKNYMKARVILPGIHSSCQGACLWSLDTYFILLPIHLLSFYRLPPFCREQAKRLHCQSFCRAQQYLYHSMSYKYVCVAWLYVHINRSFFPRYSGDILYNQENVTRPFKKSSKFQSMTLSHDRKKK